MITPNTPLATNDELEAILGKEDWLYTDKPARIGALIAKRERAARLDELSYFYEDEDGEARRFPVDENDNEVPTLTDRIKALEQEGK